MSRPVLSIKGLSIGYYNRTLISGINLEIYPGEFISLIGPNGVGKSTLLKTIAAIHRPISGAVHLCGDDVKRLNRSEMARRMGVVLTDRLESGSLKVGLLIELGRYAHSSWTGKLTAKDRLAVQMAVDAAGVSHLLERELRDISDGERQRVMVARALAQQPRLLLLDEPTAFLDAPSRAELSGLLRRISSTEDVAIITSTHDLEIALRTADKMWLMKQDGTVVVGDAEELLSNGEIERAFRNPFVKFDPITRSFRSR